MEMVSRQNPPATPTPLENMAPVAESTGSSLTDLTTNIKENLPLIFSFLSILLNIFLFYILILNKKNFSSSIKKNESHIKTLSKEISKINKSIDKVVAAAVAAGFLFLLIRNGG